MDKRTMLDKENKEVAEIKVVSVSTMLLGLNLQGDITTNMYEYLNNEIIWILHNVIRDNH